MDIAVWLYMFLVDKITSVNEDGVGTVLGGRPIKYEEIKEELGISADTYTRWIDILLTYPYIEAKRTPYGIVFKVLKAYKRFRRVAEVDSANMRRDSAGMRNVIKTIQDNTIDSSISLVDEDGNEIRQKLQIKPYLQVYVKETKESFDFEPVINKVGIIMLQKFAKKYNIKQWEEYLEYHYYTKESPFYKGKISPDLKTILASSFMNQWLQNK